MANEGMLGSLVQRVKKAIVPGSETDATSRAETFLKLDEKEKEKVYSVITPPTQAGGSAGAFHSINAYYDVVYGNLPDNKFKRLGFYRQMASFPEVADAIDEICDSCMNADENGNFIDIKVRADVKDERVETIRKEWEHFVSLYDIENNSFEYFRSLVIDGEIVFENLIDDEKSTEGILGVKIIPAECFEYALNSNYSVAGLVLNADLITEMHGKSECDVAIDPNSLAPRKRGSSSTEGFLGLGGGADLRGQYSATDKEKVMLVPINQVTLVNSGIYTNDKSRVYPILERARRAYRQLSLIEDAIIIYRLVRAPERLVFNVGVGRVNWAKAEQAVYQMMKRYQNKKVYDPATGSVANGYDPHQMLECLAMDTKVPLMDGRILTLEQISKEHRAGKTLWAYSCDPKTGKFAPGKISWAGTTRRNAKVVNVKFDNGRMVKVTPDHRFPVIGRGKVEAADLRPNDQIWSFDTVVSKCDEGKAYEQVYDHDIKSWLDVNTTVSELLLEATKSEEDDGFEELIELTATVDGRMRSAALAMPAQRGFADCFGSRGVDHDMFNERMLDKVTTLKEMEELVHFDSHRVVSVEVCAEHVDTGTLTIDQDEEHTKNHTFALDAGVYTFNSYWFPKHEDGGGTDVESIGGGANLGELDDLKYFLRKLYLSLKIPYNRFDEGSSDSMEKGESISYEEYRFAKFVARIQNQFAKGLHSAFITHLKLKGLWEKFKLNKRSFNVRFNPPTSFELYEQQKLLNVKMENYKLLADEEDMSSDLAKKKYLGWTDEEIEANYKGAEDEKIREAFTERKINNVSEYGTIEAPPEEDSEDRGW